MKHKCGKAMEIFKYKNKFCNSLFYKKLQVVLNSKRKVYACGKVVEKHCFT